MSVLLARDVDTILGFCDILIAKQHRQGLQPACAALWKGAGGPCSLVSSFCLILPFNILAKLPAFPHA